MLEKAFEIVIGEVELACRTHNSCSDCPLRSACDDLDEVPYYFLEELKNILTNTPKDREEW